MKKILSAALLLCMLISGCNGSNPTPPPAQQPGTSATPSPTPPPGNAGGTAARWMSVAKSMECLPENSSLCSTGTFTVQNSGIYALDLRNGTRQQGNVSAETLARIEKATLPVLEQDLSGAARCESGVSAPEIRSEKLTVTLSPGNTISVRSHDSAHGLCALGDPELAKAMDDAVQGAFFETMQGAPAE